MRKKKPLHGVKTLPKTLRIFVNTSGNEDFLQISETAEDAFVDAGPEDKIVGVYELKQRVRLRFRVEENPV